MKYTFLFITGLVLASCSSEKPEEIKTKKDPVVQDVGPKYSYKVYLLPEVGWCYQVFRGTKMIINQKHIPAVQGVLGFETKEQAELAVQFIMIQIRAGNEQPAVTPHELDSIGAITLDPEPILDPEPSVEHTPSAPSQPEIEEN